MITRAIRWQTSTIYLLTLRWIVLSFVSSQCFPFFLVSVVYNVYLIWERYEIFFTDNATFSSFTHLSFWCLCRIRLHMKYTSKDEDETGHIPLTFARLFTKYFSHISWNPLQSVNAFVLLVSLLFISLFIMRMHSFFVQQLITEVIIAAFPNYKDTSRSVSLEMVPVGLNASLTNAKN